MQLRKMLQNETFRNDFINRFADMLNTCFKTDNVISKINLFKDTYSTSMPEHIQRWNKPPTYGEWLTNIEHLRDFAQNRPQYMRKYIMEYFNETEPLSQDITDTSSITVDVNDSLMGYLMLSTIRPAFYPWGGVYFHDVPVPLKAVAKTGFKFSEWAGTGITDSEIEIDLLSDTSLTAVFEADTNYIPRLLFINEFMASNTSTLQDEYGEYDDWIEIFNPNPDTVDLSSFFISDNFSQPQKHQFVNQNDTLKISPYGFLLLWADGTPSQGALHLNFKLSGSGEVIALYDTSLTLIDSIVFGNQTNDVSFGRYPDGYNNWHPFNTPTPNSNNVISFVENNASSEENVIFPNPAHDIIFLKHKAKEVEIFSMMGQIIFSAINVSSLNISFLSKGLYYVRINKSQIFKLLVY